MLLIKSRQQVFRNMTKQRSLYSLLKRMMDIFASCLGLVIIAPILLVVAILIRYKLGSPVIFRQTRAGYQGQPFEILKFRTMTNTHDADGDLLSDEDRLTSFGEFLRRWSIDELPQLWNVLRGDLSLIGPRPLLMDYIDLYTPQQARRLEMKPGVTGLAQVNGRNMLTWEQKFAFDIHYVDHASVWLDLTILLKTVKKLVRPHGVSQPGHATAEAFTGTQNKN